MSEKWDRRFLKLAEEHPLEWSLDPSTKVGALVVDSHNYIRATSYNGFPKGIVDDHRLTDREVKYMIVLHAEQNALVTCARLGIATEGCGIFVTHHPCSICAAMIINAGIKKVVTYESSEDFSSRWKTSNEIAEELFKEVNIEFIKYKRE